MLLVLDQPLDAARM